MNEFWKIKKYNFLENGSIDLDYLAKIYVIEGSKGVLKKIQEPIPFINRVSRFLINISCVINNTQR